MSVQAQYLEYILEQLAPLEALRSSRMFGGIGLYSRELFFGLIDDDTLFFKTDESNIADYVARKMPRFMPFPVKTDVALGYHQVPADVIEDPEALVAWARRSVAVALTRHAEKVRPIERKRKAALEKSARGKRPGAARKPRAANRKKSARRAKRVK